VSLRVVLQGGPVCIRKSLLIADLTLGERRDEFILLSLAKKHIVRQPAKNATAKKELSCFIGGSGSPFLIAKG
jgi:hypothetical protein